MADVDGNVTSLLGDTSTSFNSSVENVQWGGTREDQATFSIGSDRGLVLNNMKLNAGSVYDRGWNDFHDACVPDSAVYTISNPNRTIYIYEGGNYVPTTGFYSVTRADGRYTIPPKK